jgi:hypothetical protein
MIYAGVDDVSALHGLATGGATTDHLPRGSSTSAPLTGINGAARDGRRAQHLRSRRWHVLDRRMLQALRAGTGCTIPMRPRNDTIKRRLRDVFTSTKEAWKRTVTRKRTGEPARAAASPHRHRTRA